MPFIIGTAGHIDHGKTSLIKALTGMDTDRLKEEKERGISIDLGFAYIDIPNPPVPPFEKGGNTKGLTRIGIVDVPGHERFIKNMLAGATGFDMVLFVVAADDGIMPQTREHLDIMHLLGVSRGIFVITKTDLIDKDQVDMVIDDVRELIYHTSLKDSPIIPVSSATGNGTDGLKKYIFEESKKVVPKPVQGFFRLPVDRSFSIKGFGTVITGTVAAGRVQKDSEVLLISKNSNAPKQLKIRGLQSHGQSMTEATAGQRMAVNLSGIPHTEIHRGDMITSPDLDSAFSTIEVAFEFLKTLKKPVKMNATLMLHHLTDETLAKVSFAGVKEAGPGEKVYGRVKLKETLVMMRGDRFILRDTAINETIGGGRALLPHLRKSDAVLKIKVQDADVYKAMDTDDAQKILRVLLSNAGFGMDIRSAGLMLNVTEQEIKTLIKSSDDMVTIGERVILKDKVQEIEESLLKNVQAYHKEKPEDVGMDEDYLLKAVGRDLKLKTQELSLASTVGVVRFVLDGLIRNGSVIKTANFFAVASHKPKAKGPEKEVEDGLLALLSGKGINPLKKEELFLDARLRQRDKKYIENLLQLLIKRGEVIRVAEDAYASKDAVVKAKDKLVTYVSEKGKIKAAEYRDILGCGRKFAIELLEYFDKERITLRSGDYRVLRKTLSDK